MTIDSKDDKIARLREIIKSHKYIDFAYLFGSQAKQTAGFRSDWDIALHLDRKPKRYSHWITFYLAAKISKEINEEVQITLLNDIRSPVFLFQVINDGLLISEKNRKKRILFETKVLKLYHDWQYILKRQMKGLV